jgi:hypothetical protein
MRVVGLNQTRVLSVRERRDGALALSDLRLLLNQPPGKPGGSFFFFAYSPKMHFQITGNEDGTTNECVRYSTACLPLPACTGRSCIV